MIKAVIFDWGGVLMRTEDDSGRRKWEQRLGLPPYSIEQVVHGSRSWELAQLGQITDEEYWADVGRQLGLEGAALREFRRDFWGGDVLDQGLVALIRRLRPQFKTALLSNAPPSLATGLQRYGVADAFDVIVISGLVGVMKPDPAIYHIVLEQLGVAPGEAVFIDDFEANIRAAQASGIHTIHFNRHTDVQAELEKLYC